MISIPIAICSFCADSDASRTAAYVHNNEREVKHLNVIRITLITVFADLG